MAFETQATEGLTDAQRRVVEEIRRVAQVLGVDRLSQRDFDTHRSASSLSTAGYQFGSWNEAVVAAGLVPYESGFSNVGPKISDDELLQEIIRVHRIIGRRPSQHQLTRHGKYSPKPYSARWGTWLAARDAAYAKYGEPRSDAE
jgi:hypothetical protein